MPSLVQHGGNDPKLNDMASMGAAPFLGKLFGGNPPIELEAALSATLPTVADAAMRAKGD